MSWISTAQTRAPNKSLLRKLGLQTNLYCADSGSKWISTAQTRAPNEFLLCRLGLQTNLYCADSGSKRISTVQTRAPNESLLRRLGLQTNFYCADSGSKRISTAQTRAPNESLLCRHWLQTNLYCADSGSKRISTVQTRAPNESLLCRLGLQTNLYCADSGSKRISTAQTRAPNKSLLCRLGLQTNLYCADSGSKRISTVQTRAPNESLLCRLGVQTNLYCADSGSKQISTVQTRAPNESLLCRLGVQMNLYCADSGSKQISTAQTRAPNKSLLHRLGLQTNLYCADSGSKRISTVQTRGPNESLLHSLGLQITSFTQDGIGHTEMYSLQFSIVQGRVVHLFTVYDLISEQMLVDSHCWLQHFNTSDTQTSRQHQSSTRSYVACSTLGRLMQSPPAAAVKLSFTPVVTRSLKSLAALWPILASAVLLSCCSWRVTCVKALHPCIVYFGPGWEREFHTFSGSFTPEECLSLGMELFVCVRVCELLIKTTHSLTVNMLSLYSLFKAPIHSQSEISMSVFLHQVCRNVSQQWMLCSEWVPSEWESDKNITIIHSPSVNIWRRRKLKLILHRCSALQATSVT